MIDKAITRFGIGLALLLMVSELTYINAKSLTYMVQEFGTIDRYFAVIGSLAFSIVTVIIMRTSERRWPKVIFPVFDVLLVFCGFNLKYYDAIVTGSDNMVRFLLSIFLALFTGFITYCLGIINYERYAREENNQAQARIDELIQKLHTTEQKYNSLKTDYEKCKTDLEVSKSEFMFLKSEFEKKESEFEVRQSEFAKLKSDFEVKQSNFEKLKSDFEIRESEFEKMKSNFEVRESYFVKLESDFKKLQSEFQKKESDFAKLQSEFAKLQSDLKVRESKIEKLQTEIEKYKTDLTERESKIGMLKTDLDRYYRYYLLSERSRILKKKEENRTPDEVSLLLKSESVLQAV